MAQRGGEGRGNEFKKFARFVLLFFRRGNFPPSIWKESGNLPPPPPRSFATNFHRRISSIATLIAFSRDKGRDYHIVRRLICSIIITSRGFYYREDFIKEN